MTQVFDCSTFRAQLKLTQQAKKPVRDEVDRLWSLVKGAGKDSDSYKKWDFLHAQLQFHENLLKALVSYDGSMVISDDSADSEEQQQLHDKMYELMTQILADTAVAFELVLSLPEAVFACAWRRVKKMNPLVVAGAAGCAAGCAAVVGELVALPISSTGAIGAWCHSHALCQVGIGHALAAKLSISAVAAAGVVAGLAALAALIVGGVCLTLYKAYSKDVGSLQYRTEQAALRVQMEQLTDQLTASPDSVEALKHVKDMYHQYFMKPLVMPNESSECIICFEKVPEGAVGEEAAVRTPGCKSTHFMHKHCWDQWCQTSSDHRCPECRR